jgi:hypothetical protein
MRKITRFGLFFVASLAATQLRAQSEPPPMARADRPHVTLTQSACPIVHNGDLLILDWNPGYQPVGSVTGVADFHLLFERPAYVRAGRLEQKVDFYTLGQDPRLTPLPNGFFHFEILVKGHPVPGEYYVVGARGKPQMKSDYQGYLPTMTNSPAFGNLCINFQD